MRRLAGISGTSASKDVRSALLEKVPPGTKDSDVIAFLETHGVPRDRFVGGQFVRYQTGRQYILALFSTPPWIINFPGNQYHEGVCFVFDSDGRLEDIIIESYTRCL
jgi:hypothetical protein